jgi:hypothetical protein
MKLKFIYSIIFSAIIFSCSDESKVLSTDLLVSNTWGKPEIIHNPSGFWSGTACGESYKYEKKGAFLRTDDCSSVVMTGTWSWIKKDKEYKLETFINNIPQKTYIISIIELNQNILHVRQREEGEAADSNNYWELKYRPRGD